MAAMFGQKKKNRNTSNQKKHDLGIFGVGMDFDPTAEMEGDDNDDDDNDDDLEAELAALQGNQPRKKRSKPKQKVMDMSTIDALAAECMKDIDDLSDGEDDAADDADLLAELEGLSPLDSSTSLDNTPTLVPSQSSSANATTQGQAGVVSVIMERKTMYETAISNAEKTGEGGKVRRYKRGLKEIERMLNSAKAGRTVNIDELPPQVATGGGNKQSQPVTTSVQASAAVPSSVPEDSNPVPIKQEKTQIKPCDSPIKPQVVSPDVPVRPPTKSLKTPNEPKSTVSTTSNQDISGIVKELSVKRDQYKLAARNVNREGDKETAKTYLLISKEFDVVIQAVEEGKEVDLSQCPPPPPGFPGGPTVKPTSSGPTTSSSSQASTSTPSDVSSQSQASNVNSGPPPTPKTVLEALEQRLEKYNAGVKDAEKEGNAGKGRRMKRIVKQYQNAIRDYKAKKPVNLEELPTPPGYAPFPTESATPATSAATRQASSIAQQQQQKQQQQQQQRQPAAAAAAATKAPLKRPAPSAPPGSSSKSAPKTRNEKELQFLIDRQKEFKVAALNAKKQGDMEKAKNYLKTSKGFDSMIEASRSGLRVDLTNVPESPHLAPSLPKSISSGSDFVVVQAADCTPDSSNREEVFASLEKALKSQYQMCKSNTQHYSKMGDIASSKRFESFALSCKKDYESLQNAIKHGNPVPRYHYENRTFNIIRSNTDLGDQDCELNIIKCINIPLPSGYSKEDMKVYVTYEFPFPSDQPQTGYTEAIKHSINPEFQQTFKLTIDRKSRALARIFRRQSVKFEIKYSRGFLKGDKTLAQASVKLATFDNRTEIHECVDLMDADKGRKAVGGKMEIKLRLREPLTDKDVEIITQKWLVIDAFVVPSNRPISASSTRTTDGVVNEKKAKNT